MAGLKESSGLSGGGSSLWGCCCQIQKQHLARNGAERFLGDQESITKYNLKSPMNVTERCVVLMCLK